VLPTTRLSISVSPMCATAAMRPSRTVKQSTSFARSPASSTSTTATTRSPSPKLLVYQRGDTLAGARALVAAITPDPAAGARGARPGPPDDRACR
jgi:hypothetical protein